MRDLTLPPGRRRAVLAAAAAIGTAYASAFFAGPANAATSITFAGGALTINGDAADNGFLVGRNAAGLVTLNGSPVLGGTVPVGGVSVVRVDGAAGNDTIRLDETNGIMPRGELVGGKGRDSLVGGSRDDTLVGGSGIDRIIGGPGTDTVRMGLDSDQFTYNVGDGNDRVDGDGGKDTLLLVGSDGNEIVIGSAAVGPRATIEMGPSFGTVDYAGIEQVKVDTRAGADDVQVDNLAGTAVTQVRLIFDTPASADADHVFVLLGDTPQRVRLTGSRTTGVTVSGTMVPVVTTGADLFTVIGGTGDDLIDTSRLPAGTLDGLSLFGGDFVDTGNDTLIGSPGNEQIFGGDGDDRLEGRGGVDILDGGPGNNVIIP